MNKCHECIIEHNLVPSELVWLGLSFKPNTLPFANNTNSGMVINKIESLLPGIKPYKTNLVKCAPLDENNKLRYPSNSEISTCLKYFDKELACVKPKIVVLLGNIVGDTITKHQQLRFDIKINDEYTVALKDGVYYLKIAHPSYLYIYRRKKLDENIRNIGDAINILLKRER